MRICTLFAFQAEQRPINILQAKNVVDELFELFSHVRSLVEQ